jgi:transcriptional regulator with XRE-family HTH domain
MPSRRASPSGLPQAAGARLRDVRRGRKVSQERAAQAAGLAQGTISNYENGLRDMAVANLIAILDDLDVSLAEFMTGIPDLLVLDSSADISIARNLITGGLEGDA